MHIDYVPLLQVQRRIQGMPRDYRRFQEYLRALTRDDGLELPPLGLVNPMAREHVTALLDALLALDADGIAAQTAAEASAGLAVVPGEFKAALIVADDLMGGWTNRYDYEFNLRFGPEYVRSRWNGALPEGQPLPRWVKHFWLTGVLWSSEPASERAVREAILLPAHRHAYLHRHGPARTLRDMLAQEGQVMMAAGCRGPSLEKEEIAPTRDTLRPFLDATDKRTAIECLFGDEAGATLGFTPRGLRPWAGLALALHDALRQGESRPQTG